MFSKTIIRWIIALNIVFTVAVIAVFWHTSNEPSVLVGAWFAFTTTELWQLASIKKTKVKGAKPDDSTS